jgi:tetratricopeptide (TPR) repeat protein
MKAYDSTIQPFKEPKKLIGFKMLKINFFSNLSISYYLLYIYLLTITLLCISCNRDQTYVEQGLEREKKGNYAEALHYYNQAYKINPENKFANERLGFLLSESQFSIIPAIFHLEKAREKDQNNEMVTLKLIDLTLFISDFTKGKRLQKEISTQIGEEDSLFINRITECLETLNPPDKKKIFILLDTGVFPENSKFVYRSLALCYENNGESLKAEELAAKYRKLMNIVQ